MLCAEPIILNFFGNEYLEAKLILLLNEGIYTPSSPNFNASLILFDRNIT